jgi:hypothetical protein
MTRLVGFALGLSLIALIVLTCKPVALDTMNSRLSSNAVLMLSNVIFLP